MTGASVRKELNHASFLYFEYCKTFLMECFANIVNPLRCFKRPSGCDIIYSRKSEYRRFIKKISKLFTDGYLRIFFLEVPRMTYVLQLKKRKTISLNMQISLHRKCPYFFKFGLSKYQNNSEYGHFSRSILQLRNIK